MAIHDPEDLDRIDSDIRINELKHEAEELTGGEMTTFEVDDCPPDISEQFSRNVVAYEKAAWTTHFQQLAEAGLELPAPGKMTDLELTAKIWELIDRLAVMQVFLTNTDHLSDRELYTRLWKESLHDAIKDMPTDEYSAWHIDLLGAGSYEDNHLYLRYYADEERRRHWQVYLRYYADEERRRHWQENFPDAVLPDHEAAPYDRDRRLPRWAFE